MTANDLLLLPFPQELQLETGTFVLHPPLAIRVAGDAGALLPAATRLQAAWQRQGAGAISVSACPGAAAVVHLRVSPAAPARAEGYLLRISDTTIEVLGHDLAGVQHGVSTLIQLQRQCGLTLPRLTIRDWPDLRARGVMLDVSRDKVPTLETLFALIEKLAESLSGGGKKHSPQEHSFMDGVKNFFDKLTG